MKPLILIIALVVGGCMEPRYNTRMETESGYQTIGGHLYKVDTTYRIDAYHAEHCACKSPK